MPRKAANPTLVMVVQQIKPEYWGMAQENPVFVQVLQSAHAANDLAHGDPARVPGLREAARAISEYVLQAWEADGREIEDAHAILHGDDTQEQWDEAQQKYVECPKYLHVHLLVKFRTRETSASIGKLAALVGLVEQCLELDKTRGGAQVAVCGRKITQQHDNGLAYLIHVKYPNEKFQYPPAQVSTLRGPLDYERVYKERYPDWIKGRAHINKKRAELDFEHVRDQVLQGEITRGQLLMTDDLYNVYSRHQRELDDALKAYGARRSYLAAAKLRNGEFSTQVVFVHGEAGVGKTQFVKSYIAAAIQAAANHGERWAVYRAATGNPLDDWAGEEVLLLDDLRAAAMDANEWLLLLDPFNASPAKARYKNKGEVAPRLIVITSTIEPVEFFYWTRQKGNVDEALDQFIRRLQATVQVIREDDVKRYIVSQVGKIDAYRWRNPKVQPINSYGQVEPWHQLTYGAMDSEKLTESGAVAELMQGLAGHSRDVPVLEATHAQMAAYHDSLAIEMGGTS